MSGCVDLVRPGVHYKSFKLAKAAELALEVLRSFRSDEEWSRTSELKHLQVLPKFVVRNFTLTGRTGGKAALGAISVGSTQLEEVLSL